MKKRERTEMNEEIKKCFCMNIWIYLLAENEETILSRSGPIFGDEGMKAIKDAFVIIVGLGGVGINNWIYILGSHATNMIARSGVRKIRIIDFDVLTYSSLNRHAVATLLDVGKTKVLNFLFLLLLF